MCDKPFDLVIFDCDGVLVDSERICVRVEAEYLAELGAPFTEAEIVERFVGSPAEIMRAAVAERLGRPLPVDWWKPYEQRYVDAFTAELTAVAGVAETLGELDVPFCVASNGDHGAIRQNLRLTGLHGLFEEGRIFSAEDVAYGKPAPDLFLYAARTLGADPARCAVVEDSRYGVRAARAAGMRSFGYAGGLTPAAWLEGPGTVVFDDMRKLPALLAGG
ncbi:HAD family hydrolase [Streptomyces sp. CA-181903]|uniref:HAD family hydrolase n=1 Tax=Streptomyces sp. CA-181903 TaxID=3240055 RepID=UPI003D932438